MTTARCPACDLGLDHCHGTLVEHEDGTTTCLDGCGGPRAAHDEVVACETVGMGCCGAGAGGGTGARSAAHPPLSHAA